jgi:hypothetical protein
MNYFLFDSSVNKTYKERIIEDVKGVLFILLFVFLVLLLFVKIFLAILLIGIITLIHLCEFVSWNRYYVTNLRIKEEMVEIIYKDKDQIKNISGNQNDFLFKKKYVWYKVKSNIPYLEVYYKNSLLLRQFESGDWKEPVFNKIINEK